LPDSATLGVVICRTMIFSYKLTPQIAEGARTARVHFGMIGYGLFDPTLWGRDVPCCLKKEMWENLSVVTPEELVGGCLTRLYCNNLRRSSHTDFISPARGG